MTRQNYSTATRNLLAILSYLYYYARRTMCHARISYRISVRPSVRHKRTDSSPGETETWGFNRKIA